MPVTRTPTIEPEDDRPPRGKAMAERTRNAQAQARHREKRKAYIDNLENSIMSLKSQLAALAAAPKSGDNVNDGETVDARVQALTDENERLKQEINSLKDKLYSGNPGSGVSSALSSPGGLEDEHTLPSLGSSTSPGATSSSAPLRLDISRAANAYPGLQSEQLGVDSMPLNQQISPSGVTGYAARRMDTGPQSAPHMSNQRHSLPSLLPSLSPSMNWGSRGGASTLPLSSPPTAPSTRQPSSVGYGGGWDASTSGSSSASSQWETGPAYAQLQHGLPVASQSGSTYIPHAQDLRSSSAETNQVRQMSSGLGEGAPSSSTGYFPASEQPRSSAQPPLRSQYMAFQEQEQYHGRSQQEVRLPPTSMQQGEDAELLDSFPAYASTSVSPIQVDTVTQRPLDAGTRAHSSSSGAWALQGQRQRVMSDMGLVGTSILPGGGLGSVPLQPGSSSEMAAPPLHPGQYDQRRWSQDQFSSAMQWSGASNSTGVNFHSLGGGQQQQQQQHPPLTSSTSSYSVHPLSSVPTFVSGSSSNSFSRSRSGSRSISSASFSDSPRSIPVSPAPAGPGKPSQSTSSFSAVSGATPKHTGPNVGSNTTATGAVKAEHSDDLPMGVPSGLGR
ncbi:hypothetical protein FRB98_009115 [Tulasnella sp. 332]|nr:hypothetical protein FRB98_009115 [Tulasnella sp. 332]